VYFFKVNGGIYDGFYSKEQDVDVLYRDFLKKYHLFMYIGCINDEKWCINMRGLKTTLKQKGNISKCTRNGNKCK